MSNIVVEKIFKFLIKKILQSTVFKNTVDCISFDSDQG